MINKVILPPKEAKVIGTLDDSILQEYNESIKSYNNEQARKTIGNFQRSNKELIGSSPFMQAYLANSGLLSENLKLATRQDLEEAIAQDEQFLKHLYTDFGIAIWPKMGTYEPNKLLYNILTKQFQDRNISLGNGKVIYFSGLAKPREHPDSDYGLVLDLKDIDTNDLKKSIKDVKEFDWDFNKGNGLASAFRGCGGWDCSDDDLDSSNSDGRVVGVEGETHKKLKFGFTHDKVREALKETGFSGAIEPTLKYLQQHE